MIWEFAMKKTAIRGLVMARCSLFSSSTIVAALVIATAAANAAAPKRIADKGVVTYCSDISFPPLEFFDPKTNEPSGLDIDLGKALAAELGVKAEFKNISFDGLIPAIQAGQCDAIMSGLFDKPTRREVLDFANYAFLGNSVIVKAGSNLHFNSLADLSGKAVATESGSGLEEELTHANDDLKKAGKPPMKIVALPKMSDAFQQLTSGLVDVFYSSTVQEAYYNTLNPGQVKLASPQTSALYIGVATVKSEADLHDALLAALKKLEGNGEYDKIIQKWNAGALAYKL
jgi:polar amino acid transport system substrate-binding protein